MILHLALAAAAALAGDPSTAARRFVYHDVDVAPIYVQVGYISAIHLLPKTEKIVDAHCGLQGDPNQEFFGVRWAGNVLYVKPGDFPGYGGLKTNIEVELASGNTMSFMLLEVSKTPGAHADLKVFVTEGDSDAVQAANGKPKYVSEEDAERRVEAEKQRVADTQAKLEQAQSQLALAATKEDVSIRHDYEMVEHKGKDFHATGYTNGKFTFVEVDAQELPQIWEVLDGKATKIDPVYRDGKYTIEHVVDEFVLKVGKSESRFRKVQRNA